MPHLDQQANYRITIQGAIEFPLEDLSGPVAIAHAELFADRTATTLSGIVTDQAGMIGLVRHLHGLGFVLSTVQRVPA